jgi:hypothetical protein
MCNSGTIFDFLYHLFGAGGSIIAVIVSVVVFYAANNSGRTAMVLIAMVLGGVWVVGKKLCAPHLVTGAIDAKERMVERDYQSCLVKVIQTGGSNDATVRQRFGACSRTFKPASEQWVGCVYPIAAETNPSVAEHCRDTYMRERSNP